MSLPDGSPSADRASSLRVLALALGTAPLIVVVAIAFVLPTTWDEQPPVVVVVLLLALVVTSFMTAELVGFRAPPLSAAEGASPASAAAASVGHFQTLMLLRFALTEMPILIGLAISFVLDAGLWPLLVAVAAGLPVLWFEIWPGRRNTTKVAAALEADGVRSWLPEALGVA